MSVYFLILLRFVHVIASVGWAGGAFIFFLFVEPTAKAMAPTGMQFVQYMVTKRRYSVFMGITSTLTVLSGAFLAEWNSGGKWLTWMQTGPGLGFALGSMVGIVVYFIGMFGVKPRAEKIAKIGAEIQAAGGPPTAVQGALLQKLDREMSRLGVADFVLVAVALSLMATARFWWF